MAASSTTRDSASLHQVSSTVADYGYPHGHLGHLSEHEQEALEAFKATLVEEGLYTPGPPPSHEDFTLVRFLRARRWIVPDALQQFRTTEEWRKTDDINALYQTIDLDAYEQSRRMYPQWTGRRDRRGIPLYLFEVKTLDNKAVAAYEKVGAASTFSKANPDGKTPPGLLRLFALYENLTRFTMPFCTQLKDREHPTTVITLSTNIVDISGVGLKQFWNLKSHMQAASQLATAHYPETLDRIFIIGAPVFFSTVWGWIKRWFDPITVSKIFILSPHEVLPTLSTFIDPRNIPKKYGGELEYNFGELPTVDPAWEGIVQFENGHKGFTTGPHVWRDIDNGARLECIGLGQANGSLREERICTIPKTFASHWEKQESAGRKSTEPAAAQEPITEGVQNLNLEESGSKKAEEPKATTELKEPEPSNGEKEVNEKVEAEPLTTALPTAAVA